MRNENSDLLSLVLHPSSFIPNPSSLILHLFSLCSLCPLWFPVFLSDAYRRPGIPACRGPAERPTVAGALAAGAPLDRRWRGGLGRRGGFVAAKRTLAPSGFPPA